MPSPSPQVSERLRKRRDFCAYVELAREEQSLTIPAAINFVAQHWPNPFRSQQAYRDFLRRECDKVRQRMVEIREDYENPFTPAGISREGLDSHDLDECSEAERQQVREEHAAFLKRTLHGIIANRPMLEEIVRLHIERKIIPLLKGA